MFPLFRRKKATKKPSHEPLPSRKARLRVEMLEDRTLLSSYSFTKIADTSPFAPRSLNDTGTVAFHSSLALAAGGQGIYTGSGGALTTIAEVTVPFGTAFGPPSINDQGIVAFQGIGFPIGTELKGIYTGSGGPITTIADTSGRFGHFVFDIFSFMPSINNTGTVAFRAFGPTPAGLRQGVFTGSGGPVTAVAHVISQFDSSFRSTEPVINDEGTIAFSTTFPGIIGVPTPYANGVFIASGGTVTRLADEDGPFTSFGAVCINSTGAVAFAAGLDAGGGGIFLADKGMITTVADTSGPFANFGLFRETRV